jgi:hypothetical protein
MTNEGVLRRGYAIERQLMIMEKRLAQEGYGEAAMLVGAALVSVSEAMLRAQSARAGNGRIAVPYEGAGKLLDSQRAKR